MNGKGWLVVGGFAALLYFAATSGRHPDAIAAAPAPTYTTPAIAYTTPAPPPAPSTYTVQPGDGLMAIAQAHGVTLGALMQANGFPNSEVPLHCGEVLVLPPSGSQVAPMPTTAPTATAYATTYPTTYPTTAPLPVPTYPVATPRPTPQPYSTGWAASCPNGSCVGQPSAVYGQPRTHLVHGKTGDYYRSK